MPGPISTALSRFAHPDPAGVQHATLVAACEKLCAEQGFAEGDLYVWLDYSCVPQSNRAMQLAAISSLHAYAACSKYFVAVVPPTAHCDTDAACDDGSYAGRGWCRLEQWARIRGHSHPPMVLKRRPQTWERKAGPAARGRIADDSIVRVCDVEAGRGDIGGKKERRCLRHIANELVA